MAIERLWEAVGPIAFVANGGADGTITLSSVEGFKVKQSVVISAISFSDLKLEVKKVISPTKLIVGPVVTTGKLLARQNLSAYTLGTSPTIRAEEQKKAVLPIVDIIQAVYRQEPGTTIGVEIDDQFGRPIDSVRDSKGINRLAVDGQFTAEVDVQVDVDIDGYYDSVNNPDPDNVGLISHERSNPTNQMHQRQRITAKRGTTNTDVVAQDVSLHDHNGNEYTALNPMPVNVVSTPSADENIKTMFDEALAVASGSETSIITYNVPVGKIALLQRISFSGENVATYNLYINGLLEERKRTHFGANLSGEMNFLGGSEEGPKYIAGDTIELRVLHTRPNPGSFNGRIQIMEVG